MSAVEVQRSFGVKCCLNLQGRSVNHQQSVAIIDYLFSLLFDREGGDSNVRELPNYTASGPRRYTLRSYPTRTSLTGGFLKMICP
jgi:hypothetical protein